ncbi:hypothetical protein [Methanofollis sp. W23]|uniref:hypothetical protein n=1 Tax=Methanofollis sp. W23 TaxID=2817849 RepID=UPI001AE9F7D3|nr:hypothetical protein [Methanofollis sp. W23]
MRQTPLLYLPRGGHERLRRQAPVFSFQGSFYPAGHLVIAPLGHYPPSDTTIYMIFYLPHLAFIVFLSIIGQFCSVPANEDKRGQISGRLPLHLYHWLEGMVCDSEHPDRNYPNLNQALIGELTKAKTLSQISVEIKDLRRRVEALEKEMEEIRS